MLDTAYPIPEPALAQAPVAVLLQHFAGALGSWLSHPYGLVQTGVLKDGKTRVPQLYRQDGSAHSIDLYPDESARAVCWFEYEGRSEMSFTDPLNKAGEWTHNLAVVCWLNLPAIDPNRGYDFSDELAQDFFTRGLLASPLGHRLTPGSIERRSEQVFRRYTFTADQQKLLMRPYAAFRIPFVVTQPFVACPLPFTPIVFNEPLLSGVSDEALLAILTARGVVNTGHETNHDYSSDYQ